MKGFRNLSQIVTLSGVHKKNGRRPLMEDLHIIEDGAIIFDGEKIIWVGTTSNIPDNYKDVPLTELQGHVLTPEIVDSHTHLIFGGNRAQEYTMRLNGADYQEIAQAGGGILSTMNHTNALHKEELHSLAKERIERIHSYGVGTIEIKSGYGLNIQKEIECAEIIHELKKEFKGHVQIFNTFMPAHAIPSGYESGREYLEKVVYPSIEQIHKKSIIDAVDIFFEEGYFNKSDTETLFEFCKNLNIPLKVHADEFNDNGGASLACHYKALSCDHLLKTGAEGIKSLANSETVATILPGTGFFLGKAQANARQLIDSGAKLSIASDFNPGSCHCDNLLLIASLAGPALKLSLAEIWTGITLNAAHSLGLKDQGAILEGMKPRFSLFKVNQVDEITYNWGRNFAISV
ncbi:MAG: imidazolonepropionase [Bacteriovoracaceae bacterium]|nr:imidazolonepropionase [Bacteriovoracaceae bacterium]